MRWHEKRALVGLLEIACDALQAAFAIAPEDDHEGTGQIDQARFEAEKALQLAQGHEVVPPGGDAEGA